MSNNNWTITNIPNKALTFARKLHELCLAERMVLFGLPNGSIQIMHEALDRGERFQVCVTFNSRHGTWADYFNLQTKIAVAVEGELNTVIEGLKNEQQ